MRTKRLAALRLLKHARLSHFLPILLLLLGGVLLARIACRLAHQADAAACRDAGGSSQEDAGSPSRTPGNDAGGASGNALAEALEGLAKSPDSVLRDPGPRSPAEEPSSVLGAAAITRASAGPRGGVPSPPPFLAAHLPFAPRGPPGAC